MDFVQLSANVADFFQAHQLISIIALLAAIYFFYQSPKETFNFLVLVAILAVIAYFIMQLGSSGDFGVSSKKEMSNKTQKSLKE